MRSCFLLAALGSALVSVCLAPRIAAAQPEPSPAEASPPAAPASSDPPASPPASSPPAYTSTAAEIPPPETSEKKKDEDRTVYISLSPIHLLMPMVEVTGELRVHRHIGVAAIAGYGSIRPEGSSTRFSVYELGGQLVGYPVGHFDHGMQLGLEVLHAGVSASTSSGTQRISGVGQGLAVGPLVGYKFASKIGFSLNVQGGVQYMAVRAQASGAGATASSRDSSLIPLLNLNLGWSF